MAKKKITPKKQTPKKVKNGNKTPWLVLALILILIGGIELIHNHRTITPSPLPINTQVIPRPIEFDFGNQTISLNNQSIHFINGQYTDSNTGPAQHTAKIIDMTINPTDTRAAAIIVDSSGGSGTFFYLIGSMKKNNQEIYSAPIPLGDRIEMQWINVDNPQAHDNGIITVQYLDRAANSPMSASPTITVTKKYAFQDDGNLIEVLH